MIDFTRYNPVHAIRSIPGIDQSTTTKTTYSDNIGRNYFMRPGYNPNECNRPICATSFYYL